MAGVLQAPGGTRDCRGETELAGYSFELRQPGACLAEIPGPLTIRELAASLSMTDVPVNLAKECIVPDFTVGSYLARRLEQIGLKHYFVVPGDYNLVLLDQLLVNKNVEQIGCCNELNASYAAEAYARVNGCGAVVTTFNVGAFSALNDVAEDYPEKVPAILRSAGPNTNDPKPDHPIP